MSTTARDTQNALSPEMPSMFGKVPSNLEIELQGHPPAVARVLTITFALLCLISIVGAVKIAPIAYRHSDQVLMVAVGGMLVLAVICFFMAFPRAFSKILRQG